MIQLYFMDINPAIDNSVLNEMLLRVSSEKKEKILRFRHDIDRKIGIYAEILVRCMICKQTDTAYRDIEIIKTPTGKPVLAGFPSIEFNISHTRNAVAAALSDSPVGVDIERFRDIDLSMTKKIFSDNEQAYVFSSADDQNKRFFDIWTKKEALLKYSGIGLTRDLKAYDVTGSLPVEKLYSITIDDYIVSVCSGTLFRDKDFLRITEPEFIKMWRNYAD